MRVCRDACIRRDNCVAARFVPGRWAADVRGPSDAPLMKKCGCREACPLGVHAVGSGVVLAGGVVCLGWPLMEALGKLAAWERPRRRFSCGAGRYGLGVRGG